MGTAKRICSTRRIDFNASDEEILTQFMNTIATGDAKKILVDLKDILSRARFDIERRTDIPPPPPHSDHENSKIILNRGKFSQGRG